MAKFRDIRNIDSLPSKDHWYEEVRRLVNLQKIYNLQVIDVIEGRLSQNVTVDPALTRELLFIWS